jgi:Cleft lip and palate transmembrane protein 1 (CLPTM1)
LLYISDFVAVADYTHERYDKLAFRYVSYVAIPALAIYAVYSLIYETHRGWYSFIISTLTSFVYMFGFVCFEKYPRRCVRSDIG